MGSRSVTGSLRLSASFELINALQNQQQRNANTSLGQGSVNRLIETGVQANESNRGWEVLNYKLSGGDSVEINLSTFAGWDIGAGDGNDGLGLPMDLEEVVLILIEHVGGNGFLEVRPSTASGWTPIGEHLDSDGASLGPEGVIIKMNPGEQGFDVIPGTSERITFEAISDDVEFHVLIIGRNDDDDSSSSSSSSTESSESTSSSSASSSSESSLSSGNSSGS